MTIACEPKPLNTQTQRNVNNFPSLREITDENIYEEKPDENPDGLCNTADDWMKMYLEGNMEENY